MPAVADGQATRMRSPFWLNGLGFALLWSSASVAAKFGLQVTAPITLFTVRFFGAGLLLLGYTSLFTKEKLPQGREWAQLGLFGLLNTALYLALFVLAMTDTAAGIGSLAIALNPLFISVLSAIYTRQRPRPQALAGILTGLCGVALAAWPLLRHAYATPRGLLLLLLSMLSYSVGTIYFSQVKWNRSRVGINGWQTLLSGCMLLPFCLLENQKGLPLHQVRFWLSELWLIFPVSIAAVQLWLYLLRTDALRASFFLFLCPIFGFLYASLLLGEPFTWHTAAGTLLVLAALWLGRR